jgi:hypothetical protein
VDSNRYMRVRELVRGINRQRKLQARKIDILCTDMVSAHRSMIERLDALTYTNSVYESLAGCSGPAQVLDALSSSFSRRYSDCGTAIIMLDANGVSVFDTNPDLKADISLLPSCFTGENVRAICSGNRVCAIPELLEMLVEIPPLTAEQSLAAAIPLRLGGDAIGTLLLYNTVEGQLHPGLIHTAIAVSPVIARALAASRPVHGAC